MSYVRTLGLSFIVIFFILKMNIIVYLQSFSSAVALTLFGGIVLVLGSIITTVIIGVFCIR